MINEKHYLIVNKFHDCRLAPFKVTKGCSYLVYVIFGAQSGKTKRVHFNLLKAANRNKACEKLCHNAAARKTKEESSEEEVPFINEVPTGPAIANAAVLAKSQYYGNLAVANSQIQSMAKPPQAIPVVNADHASTVAAPPTVEPVVPQRGAQSATTCALAQSSRQETRF